jgi:hypothetical protein
MAHVEAQHTICARSHVNKACGLQGGFVLKGSKRGEHGLDLWEVDRAVLDTKDVTAVCPEKTEDFGKFGTHHHARTVSVAKISVGGVKLAGKSRFKRSEQGFDGLKEALLACGAGEFK